MKRLLTSVSLITLCLSSAGRESVKSMCDRVFAIASEQFTLMDSRLAADMMPRSVGPDGTVIDNKIDWWCSGFFPGSLWYVYGYGRDEAIRAVAERNTLKLAVICSKKTHHDIGFQVNCSYGNAYRFTGERKWLPTVEAAAAKLATRYSDRTKCIKSWDNKKWQYPVIIDNMMNLELLMNASDLFGCDSLRAIACTHARTTMANHFRDDFSTWHLLAYDPWTGAVTKRQTVQGFSDDSAWARGQAWALYGYTMMYRESAEKDFLAQAENIARYLIGRLPKDGVPYWDFDCPDIPDTFRDASAAAIMASAFIELAGFTKDRTLAKQCRKTAELQLRTLASDEYLAKPGENGNFLLKHSVGSLPGNSEVDVPLTYADYYFLEALYRLSGICPGKSE